MERHEATFDIESRSDARTIRRLGEQVYDTMREELRRVDDGDDPPSETLQAFDDIRAATQEPAPGTLTVVYERSDESFEE